MLRNELVMAKIDQPGDRESLVSALSVFGEKDNDFNGENGSDYLWDCAKGYESNRDYCLDYIKNLPEATTDAECIKNYMDLWVGSDGYYKCPIYDVIYDVNGNAEFIALSYMT